MTAPAARITKVEYQELLARAAELEQPILDKQGRGAPTLTPQPPCALPIVKRAAADLDLSAENLRYSLKAFDTTRQKLAEALRNASRAYLLADSGAAEAINNETSVSEAVLAATDEAGSGSAMLRGAATLGAHKPPEPLPPEIDELHVLETTAMQLEQLDQGASLNHFIELWTAYRIALRDARERFRPFQEWHGDAADAVFANFESHRDWLNDTASLCQRLIDQTQPIVDAFRELRSHHVYDDDKKKYDYKGLLEFEAFWTKHMHSGYGQFIKHYSALSQNSQSLLATFKSKAGLPLGEIKGLSTRQPSRIDPPKPYTPPAPRPGPLPPVPIPTPDPGPDPTPTPFIPSGGLPSTPTPSKPVTDPVLAPAFKAPDLKGAHAGGGMKPMSFEGAGAGAAPLGSWGDESTKAAAAGSGAGGQGRGGPGVPGGAMGGGGMGGGAPQGAKDGGKSKRVQGDEEEAMYTEDRAWTEGVIGLRGAKEVPNQ